MSPATKPLREADLAGSPDQGEPVFLAVGKLRRPHGVQGEIMMDLLTDFPDRLQPGARLYVGRDKKPLELLERREHQGGLLVRFADLADREQVGELRNQVVFINAEDSPQLPQGQFYHHQMVGLRVISQAEGVLGELVEILETGANDVLIVRAESGKDILLPVTDEVIEAIDLQAGELRVKLLPGLLPD